MTEQEVPMCPICDEPFYTGCCSGCGFDEEEYKEAQRDRAINQSEDEQ